MAVRVASVGLGRGLAPRLSENEWYREVPGFARPGCKTRRKQDIKKSPQDGAIITCPTLRNQNSV